MLLQTQTAAVVVNLIRYLQLHTARDHQKRSSLQKTVPNC